MNNEWASERLPDGVFLFLGGSQLLVQPAVVQVYGLLSSAPDTYF